MGISITRLIWIIGIHSIVHAIFGIFFISTSFYVNYSEGLIYAYIALHVALLVLGFSIFCIVVWRRPLCARIFAIILLLFTLVYLIVGVIYFLTYLPFFGNSIFDSFFFYTEVECWCGPDYALTFWHIFALLLPLVILLWFFYAYLLCKLADCACCIPCPPPPCMNKCENTRPCGAVAPPCCQKPKWYHKIIKPGPCSAPLCRPKHCPPCPPCNTACPPVCATPCPQQQQQQQQQQQPPPPQPPCAPPFQSCPKKAPKFVLTLRPGRMCNKQ